MTKEKVKVRLMGSAEAITQAVKWLNTLAPGVVIYPKRYPNRQDGGVRAYGFIEVSF